MIEPFRRFVVGTARLHRVYSRIPVGLVVIFQRGRRLEKVKPSERRPFHRHHTKFMANCLRVDAKRKSAGVRQEQPRCEADQLGKFFPPIALDR